MALTRRRQRELQEFAQDVHRAVKDDAQTILRNAGTLAEFLAGNVNTRLSKEDVEYLFGAVVDLHQHYTPNPLLEDDDPDADDPRGIPKPRVAQLKGFAQQIRRATAGAPGMVGNAKAVFNYITIKMRQKVTMGEATRVKEIMDEMAAKEVLNANMVRNALVLIRCRDAASFDTRTIEIYRNTPDGKRLAQEAFINYMRRAIPGIHDREIAKGLESGYYEIGPGFLTIVPTTNAPADDK